ncbi:MAG TPA: DUF3047 domain-containing protein [Burkholderiaceae bacterium]|nr:DUF3047 domain-containing protein [Burkholderiaceae bacterium]
MNSVSMSWRAAVLGLGLLSLSCGAWADGPMPLPFGPVGPEAHAPWHVTGLPNQTKPYTKFSVVDLDGHRAVRVEAESSYGNLVYPLELKAVPAALSWRWRVEELIDADDLRQRSTDDNAIKVCVSFDMPIDKVPFLERQLLRSARGRTNEPVPSASVCYVWDAHLPVGTSLDNAFTRRIRYKVLQSGPAHLHQWMSERRNVGADFLELFGGESSEVPPVIGVAVGADSDNTHTHSLAHVADVVIEP